MKAILHTVAGPPLDYNNFSFKDLKCLLDLKQEEAKQEATKKLDKRVKDEKKAKTGSLKKVIIKQISTSVKLSSNCLENLVQLPEALEAIMAAPFERLEWLDVSFNCLTTVEPVLLKYENLKALYMHGNRIQQLSTVEKLQKLPKLLSLTMNGNPVESSSKYRTFILAAIPQLKTLDHSSITADEVEMAVDWWRVFCVWRAKRKEEKDEAALLSYQG
eukprot:GEMP01051607.1.p1 GENE.GEMP01051607.1~~GEMP01051607.1.p1  ORF type:complete len:217 (+),score=57.92 GEMP01051607.1:112-762(+)